MPPLDRPKKLESNGFTLIELMLAAIALPKFSNLVDKAWDAVVRGQTGTIRSAVGIYYADNAGMYPLNPSALFTDLQNNPFV